MVFGVQLILERFIYKYKDNLFHELQITSLQRMLEKSLEIYELLTLVHQTYIERT